MTRHDEEEMNCELWKKMGARSRVLKLTWRKVELDRFVEAAQKWTDVVERLAVAHHHIAHLGHRFVLICVQVGERAAGRRKKDDETGKQVSVCVCGCRLVRRANGGCRAGRPFKRHRPQ